MDKTVTHAFYDAFQRVETDRWDAVVDKDVEINSPGAYGMAGLQVLKDWASGFTQLAYKIDLVDEHLALDAQGDGRGFITFNLHWKHVKDFFGLKPTGREGTSVETLLFRIKAFKIVRIDVADNTADLVVYLWDRGWPLPHNIRPNAIVEGVTRANRD
jgi:hypothetical protein